jgi:hypothetical protein
VRLDRAWESLSKDRGQWTVNSEAGTWLKKIPHGYDNVFFPGGNPSFV